MNPYPYGNQPGGYPTPYPVNYVPSANPIGFQGVQNAPNFGQHAMNPPMGSYGNSMAPEPFYPSYPNYPMGNNQQSYSSPPVAPIPSSHQQFGGYHDPSSYSPLAQTAPTHGLYPNVSPAPGHGTGVQYAAPQHFSQNANQHTETFQVQQPSPSITATTLGQTCGTIFPTPNFNVEKDCQDIAQAMKGLGTNERALIDIIVKRSNRQRQQIRARYKVMFGQDVVEKLSNETSGHFRETLAALFQSPEEFDASSLHEALNSSSEGTLREILLTRTNTELRAINEAFRKLYNKDLENQIKKRVSGTDFKRMLISAVQAQRDELSASEILQIEQRGIDSIVDRNRARQDAESLYKAGEAKFGTDEKTFNAIFLQRSYYHLRVVFDEYRQKYGKDIAQVIRSEFSGDAKEAYLVLITCIRDRATFFAERLKSSMAGIGTRDKALIRILVTRSEIDLAEIKQRYEQIYRKTLAQDIRSDTSGDYERILLAIVK